MDRKLFIVANPASGRQRIGKILSDLSDFLRSKDCPHDFFETSFERRGQQTVKDNLDDSFTDLIIVGGDGTINEAINGLEKDIPVSFIPAGTGDDFVKMIDIGKKTTDQFHTLLNGKEKEVDLGLCNDRKFINGVGIGFDGQIVADMLKKKVKYLSGHAKYYYHVLSILASYKSRIFKYEMEGEFFEKANILMTIANGTTFGGGFRLTPNAKIDDGFLDVCEIGAMAPWKRFANNFLLQNGSHHKLKEVNMYSVKNIIIGSNPQLEAHIDGEYLGNPPFNISVLPSALKVRVRK